MTNDDHGVEHRPDWLIPAIIVGVAVLVLVAVGIIVAVSRSSSEPETLPEQLEAYTTCLRSNGATVPLVEARDDGGVAIVLDGGLFDGEFDLASLGEAVAACDEEAPEQLGFLSSLVGGFDLGALVGGWDLDGLEELDFGFLRDEIEGGAGRFDHREPGAGFSPGRGCEGRLDPEALCDALADGALPPDLPGTDRLREACEAIGA